MKKIIMTATAVLLLASPVMADSTVKSMPQYDQKEIQSKLQEAMKLEFDNMDTNRDGKISNKEYLDYQLKDAKAKSEASFKNLDKDNDGNVSEAEYSTALQDIMHQLAEKMKSLKPQQ